jgi:hypothetical protein
LLLLSLLTTSLLKKLQKWICLILLLLRLLEAIQLRKRTQKGVHLRLGLLLVVKVRDLSCLSLQLKRLLLLRKIVHELPQHVIWLKDVVKRLRHLVLVARQDLLTLALH